MPNLFAFTPDESDHPLASIPLRTPFSYPLEVMEITGKLKTGEAGRNAPETRAGLGPQTPQGGGIAKSKNEGVNFHIEITVAKGEHAHVFKFDCGDKHVTAAGKGLVRMRGDFGHLRKDQVSALGNLVTDFVGDMGLILLREKR
jgi:hypothetical protein